MTQSISSAPSTAVERMEPASADIQTFWEHISRYAFATNFISGKCVLDIACGEGYGTAALAKAGASSVIGVDISDIACKNAIRNYGVDARVGSATEIPLADSSVDIVVSFETIEHIDSPDRFISECYRVLRPNGMAIISTPNAKEGTGVSLNPFHPSEMSEVKFLKILTRVFSDIRVFEQSTISTHWRGRLSLSSLDTHWQNVRGYWRFRNALSPHLNSERLDEYRSQPVKSIMMNRGWLSQMLDPHIVRSRSNSRFTCPQYIVAVATKYNK